MTPPHKTKGFTLIELIMVMVIVAVLAIAAIPRFIDRQSFEARGFYDQTLSMLRYAQKVAIAQRTNVFVNVNSASRTLCLTYVADSMCTNTTPLQIVVNPADQQKFSKTAATGISIASSVSPFSFSALGKPNPDGAVTLSVSGDGVTRSISVERETGYVH